ncbi:MAG: hypothetical protein U0414_44175 [Polyangiaceae bacterium]
MKMLDDFNYLMIEQYASPGVTHFHASTMDSALPTFELSTPAQRDEAAAKIVAFVERSLRHSLEIKDGTIWTADAKEKERDRLLALTPALKADLDELMARAKRVLSDTHERVWLELSDTDRGGAHWLLIGPSTSVHLD